MNKKQTPISMMGMLVAIGIVYGDIGTSPMYVIKSIIESNGGLSEMNEELILGSLSLVIWTMTLLTTVKYIFIAMKADNHGEGGIFALYSLVSKCKKWLIIPAMIGGSALLADGILTPAVTVTTAVEGLRSIDSLEGFISTSHWRVIIITLIIISILFTLQHSGTNKIGKAFGPIMVIWFLILGVSGAVNMVTDLNVLRAFNPLRGIQVLFSPANKTGLMLLGCIFLSTTGAEALYSDMGHVGKWNIYGSWPFVKICLILNYLGQGAWLISQHGNSSLYAIEDINPFFQMFPENIRIYVVIISTFAAIIASQALISGSFTLVSEAISLDLMPHLKIMYPSKAKSQIYIPLVNNTLWISCMCVVLYFKTSAKMEAAYGLSITITMLMTTLLLYVYLRESKKGNFIIRMLFLVLFGGIEFIFLYSSLTKFMRGGYVAVLIALILLSVMVIWKKGTEIEHSQSIKYKLSDFTSTLKDLKNDENIPLFADNLVYLTSDYKDELIDRDILYSILDKQPKRAQTYWFISVTVTDAPYTGKYRVETFGTDFIFRVHLLLGYNESQRINIYLRQIIADLFETGEMPPHQHVYSIYKNRQVGNFCFCFLRKQVSSESGLSALDVNIMKVKYAIRRMTGTPMKWYGLETSLTAVEYVPLFVKSKQTETHNKLKRVNQ